MSFESRGGCRRRGLRTLLLGVRVASAAGSNSAHLPKTHRKEHGVDIQGEFDEVVEVVGLPQLGVGRHGCLCYTASEPAILPSGALSSECA